MRVLIASDISTDGTGNPFLLQLLRALTKQEAVEAVQHGTSWFFWKEPDDTDIVHLHWPEWLLPEGREPTEDDLANMAETLRYWSSKAALITTIHNEHPHYRNTDAFRRLYELVYRHTDGFIHMGEASVRMIRERFPRASKEAQHTVIPHGDFRFFVNAGISREGGRRHLGLPSNDFVILSLGWIRHLEELDLLLKGFNDYDDDEKKLVLANRLPWPSWKTLAHYTLRLKLRLSSNTLVKSSFVPPDNLPYFAEAADVLVIPRKKLLNSGNLQLGFTFGNVVVGPDEGVVGEILRATGNPVFNPENPASLSRAFGSAKELAAEGKGIENRSYAKEHWNWKTVSQSHVSFYEKVKRSANAKK